MSRGCVGGATDDSNPPARDPTVIIIPPEEASCDLIRYIDESGSSSCESSLIGDVSNSHLLDDTASLSHLLDDVGPGQFSFDAFDDLASMSCGYASFDGRSDEGSDDKLGVSVAANKYKKVAQAQSDEVLADGVTKGCKSLERQRKLLKPCGQMLMRRSLCCEEIRVPFTNVNTPSASLPGSTKVIPRHKVNNHIGDYGSSKGSSHRSFHISQSSIKSSDNIMDDAEFSEQSLSPFSGEVGFLCSTPLMPPLCTPPPIPSGESSYVTTATSSSSLDSDSQFLYKTQKLKTSDLGEEIRKFRDNIDLPRKDSSYEAVNLCGDIVPKSSNTDVNNAINNERNLLVPLADMDECSDVKGDHAFDTLESKSDKDEKMSGLCRTEDSDKDVALEDGPSDSNASDVGEPNAVECFDKEVCAYDDLDSKTESQKSFPDCDVEMCEDEDCDQVSNVNPYVVKYGEAKIESLDVAEVVLNEIKSKSVDRTMKAQISAVENVSLGRGVADEDVTIKIEDLHSGDDDSATRSDNVRVEDTVLEVIPEETPADEDVSEQSSDVAVEGIIGSAPDTPVGTWDLASSRIHFPKEAWSPGLEPPPHPLLCPAPAPSSLSHSTASDSSKSFQPGTPSYSGPSSPCGSLPRSPTIVTSPPYLVIPSPCGTPNCRRTPPPFLNLNTSHPTTPTSPISSSFLQLPLTPSSPNSLSSIPDSLSTPVFPAPTAAPHHYISSLRVASTRGTADMGGALVARVAAFLKTQYKSYAATPLRLPWCPKFQLCVSEFTCNVTPTPAPGHPTAGGVAVPGHHVLRNTHQVGGLEGRPGRVLVESGRCCYARTALPFSLAYHWAVGSEEYHLHHYSVVFVLTLRDFRSGSLFQHLCKEVLPKHILSKEAMTTLWNYLRKIEDKVLFLLVGWNELNEGEAGDLLDLVGGSLLPGCSVLLTSRVDASVGLPAASLNRVYRVTGLHLEGTRELLAQYCSTLGRLNFSEKLVNLIEESREEYLCLAQCPLTAVVLAVLYEDMGGKLPSRPTDLYSQFLKHMTRINLLRRGEPMCYDVLPEKYNKLFQEFGKLALEAIKYRSPYFTPQDLKTKCQHGQELADMGLLIKMQSASKHTKKEHYTALHSCLLEYLAAYYLSGLVGVEPLLQQELDALAQKIDLTQPSTSMYGGLCGVRVMQCLVGLLGRNAYVVLNHLAQLAAAQQQQQSAATLLLRLLREAGRGQMNVLEVCKHISSRDHVVIQSHSPDLDDWGRLLYSPDCSLETIDILVDLDADTRWMADRQDAFFTSLCFNESARNIKLTCVLGGSFGEAEVTRLVSYVRSVLTKRRLEGFELQVTSVLDLDDNDCDKNENAVLATDKTVTEQETSQLEGKNGDDAQNEGEEKTQSAVLPAKEGCDKDSFSSSTPLDDSTSNNDSCKKTGSEEAQVNGSTEVTLRNFKSLDRHSRCFKRRSVYDSTSDDVEAGINELEHTVCELISKVGDDIGNGFIEEEEEDIDKVTTSRRNSSVKSVSAGDDSFSMPLVPRGDGAVTGSSLRRDNSGIVRNTYADVRARRTVEVLSPVLEMICDTLPELTPALTRLVLAMDLDADQLVRLCAVVGAGGQVQTLHLPRLSCGSRGLAGLAGLMTAGRLHAVSLAGSISTGTLIDERSTALGGCTPSPTSEENPFVSVTGRTAHSAITNHVTAAVSSDANSKSNNASKELPAAASLDSAATLPKQSKNRLRPSHLRPAISTSGNTTEEDSTNISNSTRSFHVTSNNNSSFRHVSQRPPSTLYAPSQSLLAFWSFTDAEGNRRSVFNSLPRSFYQSLPRRVRHNAGLGSDKRVGDVPTVLLQKTTFPPPVCCPALHDNGFHEVLQALRDPGCRVSQLDLSKSTLGAEDLVCLGEALRHTTCLTSLHLEGLARMAEIIPVLIGLQCSACLQLLDLSSPHLLLGDAALQVSLAALARCAPLRFLVINGWTFQLESERSLVSLVQFLASTQVQHLELAGVRVSVSIPDGPLARLGRQDDLTAALTEAVPRLANDTIAFLNMDNVELSINGNLCFRGPHLLPLVRHLPRLLDLSLACHSPTPSLATAATTTLNSPLSSTLLKNHHSPHLSSGTGLPVTAHHELASHCPGLQGEQTKALFATLASAFPSLKRINMSGWNFSLDNCSKVLAACGRSLKSSGLREVVVGGASVRGIKGVASSGEAEHLLLAMFTQHLHHLAHLSLMGISLTPAQATAFGKSLRDKSCSPSLQLDTRGLQYPSVRALRQTVSEGGRHEVRYLGGPAATYLIVRTDRRERGLGRWACVATAAER